MGVIAGHVCFLSCTGSLLIETYNVTALFENLLTFYARRPVGSTPPPEKMNNKTGRVDWFSKLAAVGVC